MLPTRQRLSAAAIAMAVAGATGNGSSIRALSGFEELEIKLKTLGTDLDSEYELIQKKKSLLSANMRRQVVRVYEARSF